MCIQILKLCYMLEPLINWVLNLLSASLTEGNEWLLMMPLDSIFLAYQEIKWACELQQSTLAFIWTKQAVKEAQSGQLVD